MNTAFHKSIKYGASEPLAADFAGTAAYVYVVMLSDEFAVAAAVSAFSLRSSGSKYPIYCLAARAATDAHSGITAPYIKLLGRYFDRVVEVPLIEHDSAMPENMRGHVVYGAWSRYAFTKLHIFDKNILPFDKVLYLDADTVVVRNIDHLFSVQAPAATFSSPSMKPYSGAKLKNRGRTIPNPYGEIDHGSAVSRASIARGFSESIVCCGNMLLVSPSAAAVTARDNILAGSAVYGHTGCYSRPEDQLFAEILMQINIGETAAYHIHQTFNWSCGKPQWIAPGVAPAGVIQYTGTSLQHRPWNTNVADECEKPHVEEVHKDVVRRRFDRATGRSVSYTVRVSETVTKMRRSYITVYADIRLWWYFAHKVATAGDARLVYRGQYLDYLDGKEVPHEVRRHFAVVSSIGDGIVNADLARDAINSHSQSYWGGKKQ